MTRHHLRSIPKSYKLHKIHPEMILVYVLKMSLEMLRREAIVVFLTVYSNSSIASLLINLHTHKNNPEISLCFYVLFRISYMQRQVITRSRNISSEKNYNIIRTFSCHPTQLGQRCNKEFSSHAWRLSLLCTFKHNRNQKSEKVGL